MVTIETTNSHHHQLQNTNIRRASPPFPSRPSNQVRPASLPRPRATLGCPSPSVSLDGETRDDKLGSSPITKYQYPAQNSRAPARANPLGCNRLTFVIDMYQL